MDSFSNTGTSGLYLTIDRGTFEPRLPLSCTTSDFGNIHYALHLTTIMQHQKSGKWHSGGSKLAYRIFVLKQIRTLSDSENVQNFQTTSN
jgi:hypothetical protein